MRKLNVALPLVVGAAVLGVVGVAVAFDDDGSQPVVPRTVGGVLVEGTAPSGTRYTISRVDAGMGSNMLCSETSTEVARAQGCQPIPDENGQFDGRPIPPSMRLLGTDRFVSIVAAKGVEGMRVKTLDGDPAQVTAQEIEVDGVGRLMLATIGGRPVTSDDPDPERVMELIDGAGRVIQEVPVPRVGGG